MIRFVDVAPRDGFQNWAKPVSTEIKERTVRGLLEAGVQLVEATSFVSPKWVPQMADAEELIDRLGPDLLPSLRVLVPNLRGFERAAQAGVRRVVVPVSATDGFNLKNLNHRVDESLAEIRAICDSAAGWGAQVDGAVSVAWGCPFDGRVEPSRALSVAAGLLESGCAMVSLADTIGVADPAAVRDLSGEAIRQFGADRVAVHFHDTRGLGVANVLAALEVGVVEFEGSLAGIGGCPFAPRATGNVCSEDLLHMLELMGYRTGVSMPKMLELAAWLAGALETTLPGMLYKAGLEPWVA